MSNAIDCGIVTNFMNPNKPLRAYSYEKIKELEDLEKKNGYFCCIVRIIFNSYFLIL